MYLSMDSFSQSHETIEHLDVNYRLPGLFVGDTTDSGIIKALPEATITFYSLENVSKIYLKIVRPSDQATIYEVNYGTNSSEVTGNNGMILYSKVSLTVRINSPATQSLIPYVYELRTEDNEGKLSEVFSEIH